MLTRATSDDERARAHRGVGLAFPLSVTPHGKLATARAETKIEQSIWLILSTAKGERLMRPSYGAGIHDLVFEPNEPQSITHIVDQLRRALVEQEPRIAVLDVNAETSAGEPNLLLLRIDYRVHGNNSSANMVYPFFVREGA
jgi:phage baseplate assembly protein W